VLSQNPSRHLTVVPEPVTTPPFGCTVQAKDDVVTVLPAGELDIATVPLLEAAMTYQRDLGTGALVVDLRDVTFIDSCGVRLLLTWAREAARRGHDFRVIPGSERVQLVFAMSGVLEALDFAG
jgi:anti-sigma B factor antagonist